MAEKDKIKTVRDTDDRIYKLHDIQGKGGQGVVWFTNHERILVKLNRKDSDMEGRKSYYRRLKYLMLRQDLPHAYVSMPKALLAEPDCGYVMELMDDMVSLEELLTPPSNTDITSWYKNNGGVRRRIKLLLRFSEILLDIHSKGFIYGDISPKNVFVSKQNDYFEVQLIDCDNLTTAGTLDGAVYSIKYGAPELVRGESGHNTLTDSWSFAVLAYQLLT
ncbi:MAG: protein kinase, partial [Lentisphaerota bacterium]